MRDPKRKYIPNSCVRTYSPQIAVELKKAVEDGWSPLFFKGKMNISTPKWYEWIKDILEMKQINDEYKQRQRFYR